METLKAHFDALRAADGEALHAALATAEKAVAVAGTEASARLEAHNGLIRQMRDQAGAFATRDAVDRRIAATERFQAKVTGALILVGAIGVANLVKVWTK